MQLFKKVMPFILMLGDMCIIAIAILLAYKSREILIELNDIPLKKYLTFFPLYVVPLFLFIYEGIYRYRYDFWQETKHILQALFLSMMIVFAYLALTRNIEHYSRFVILSSFFYMGLLIPFEKRFLKWFFFKIGWWKKEAKLYGKDPFLEKKIFSNPYLGYIPSSSCTKTVFLNARNIDPKKIDTILKKEIRKHHEVIFISTLKDFNLAQSQILEFFNFRTNLILLTNRLEDRGNLILKEVFDKFSAIVITILLLPLMGIISLIIFILEPTAPIFYRQKRLGKDGKVFEVLKFRTMKVNSDQILTQYLKEHPYKAKEWKVYKKIKGYDPRVTRVGIFLRKYSLDELPQLINVIKGEMSLVGPRPYIPSELEKIEEVKDIILSVKPGLTGLWQVLGRNNLSFEERLEIDRWYVYNWSLWGDLVILIKTFKAVFEKEKAH